MGYLRNRWLVYVKERFPLLTFGALSAGIVASSFSLEEKSIFFVPFTVCFVGTLLFFGLQRLMDDFKSADKDKIAFPERPLPRKILAKEEVSRVIQILQKVLLGYSLMVWVTVSTLSALFYVLAALFLWWEYRDFYGGRWLMQKPFLKGFLRHLGLFPLVLFCVSGNNPWGAFGAFAWTFAGLLAAAFFCYDICVAFNPQLHPVLGTYLHFYGFRRSFEVAAMTLVVSAMCAVALGLDELLLPCEFIVLVAMTTLFLQPSWFRLPAVAASISLMVHAWAPALIRFYQN